MWFIEDERNERNIYIYGSAILHPRCRIVEYYSTPQVKTDQKKYWALLNNVQYHPALHLGPWNTEQYWNANTE